MAFDSDKRKITEELDKLRVPYSVDEGTHRIKTNEYELSYTNGYYFKTGESKSMGRGQQDFFKLFQR